MKKIACVFFLLILSVINCMPSMAAEIDTSELTEAVDGDTRRYLEAAGAGDGTYDGGSMDGLFDALAQMAQGAAGEPIRNGGIILFIIILSALLEATVQGGTDGARGAASSLITLCAAAAVLLPISSFLEQSEKTVADGCGFTSVFVPLYAGLMVASGQPTASAGYSAAALAAGELCSAVVISVILPLTKVFLALSVCSAAYPALKCDRLTELAHTGAKWFFTVTAMLYSGVLSVTNAVSASHDNAATKAVKFAFSGAVPVAGSAIGDALSAVRGSVSILRTSVGGFGMIAAAFIFLPRIFTAAAWSIVLNGCSIASEAFGCSVMTRFLKSLTAVVGIILSLLIFVSFILIISTAVTLGNG